MPPRSGRETSARITTCNTLGGTCNGLHLTLQGTMLMALGRRANMNAEIVMIYDVHYNAQDPQGTSVALFLKGCASQLCNGSAIGQVRFHAVHDFSKFMLPSAPYYHLPLIELRAKPHTVPERTETGR
eukprot:7070875-Prymnesium_polylepis.1